MWHMREGGGGKTSKAVRFQVLWKKKVTIVATVDLFTFLSSLL